MFIAAFFMKVIYERFSLLQLIHTMEHYFLKKRQNRPLNLMETCPRHVC